QLGQQRYRCAGTDGVFKGATCWETANNVRLDRLVLDEVGRVVGALNQAGLRRAWHDNHASDGKDSTRKRIAKLETQIKAERADIDRATDLLIRGSISQETYNRAIDRHQRAADAATDELDTLRRERGNHPWK